MKYFIDLSLLKRNRKFRLLFIGQFVSFFGTMVTGVTLPYQVYHLTQSTLMVGLLSLAQLLPLLATALLGGVLADRHNRRFLLLAAETLLAIGCLVLAWNASLAMPHIALIFIVSSIMAALGGLHRPALDSIQQQLISQKDLPSVGALTTFVFSICMIAGPAIGGLLLAYCGVTITYLLDFASFAISFCALLLIGTIETPLTIQSEAVWYSLKQGIRYAFSKQELLGSYLIDFVAMIFGMPNALFPAIAASMGGVKTLGLLYAAPAIGGVFIALFSGWTEQVKRHGLAIVYAALFWGVAIICFGLTKNLWLALFFLSIAGGCDALSGIFRSVLWNQIIPNEYRGRLSGIAMIGYLSGPKLGDTEAGLVAAAFGVTASIISGGALCIVSVGICCYFLPKFLQYAANDTMNPSTGDVVIELSDC